MPSPFPGMDPFIEGDLWMSFMSCYAVELSRELSSLLRPRYSALVDKHLWRRKRGEGEPRNQYCIRVRQPKQGPLITVIEFLSPTDKQGDYRRQYLEQRRGQLLSDVNLLEFDLTRLGQRLPLDGQLPNASYYVMLSRAKRRPFVEVWPIQLSDRLPTIAVPLQDGDCDVVLDLGVVFARVYDEYGFDLAVEYSEEPELDMTGEESDWVNSVLTKRGFR